MDRANGRLPELRPDQARLDDRDADPEALDLEAQRVRDRLDRVLGGVVDPAAGEHEPPAHRADVDDPPVMLAPHPRQHQLAHPDEAEHVRLELAADLLHRDVLDRPGLAVAGVVHERANRALVLLDAGDGGPHRLLVCHVKRQQPAALLLEVGDRLEPARCRVRSPRLV